MTERERLIELIREAMRKHEITIENYVIPTSDYIADYLLANGVIVPPCKVGDTVDEQYKNLTEGERQTCDLCSDYGMCDCKLNLKKEC